MFTLGTGVCGVCVAVGPLDGVLSSSSSIDVPAGNDDVRLTVRSIGRQYDITRSASICRHGGYLWSRDDPTLRRLHSDHNHLQHARTSP